MQSMTQQCISNRCLLEGDRNYMFRPLLAIVRFLIRKKKHLLVIHCCVIDCDFPTLNYYTQRGWQISDTLCKSIKYY